VSEDSTSGSRSTPKWAKAFRVVSPSGSYLDGAELPSGRVILDSMDVGLVEVAISWQELANVKYHPEVKVVWEISPEHEKMIADQPDVIFSDRDRAIYERGRLAGIEESAAVSRWDRKENTNRDFWIAAGRPCQDPQCRDSTWDHPCPTPPAGVSDD
jgi:hypothetical protein